MIVLDQCETKCCRFGYYILHLTTIFRTFHWVVMTFNPRLLATGRVARRTTSDPKEVEQVALVPGENCTPGIITKRVKTWSPDISWMCFFCFSLKTDIDHLLNFLAGVFLASCPHIWVCQKLGQPFKATGKRHRCYENCNVLGFTPFLDTPILAFEIFVGGWANSLNHQHQLSVRRTDFAVSLQDGRTSILGMTNETNDKVWSEHHIKPESNYNTRIQLSHILVPKFSGYWWTRRSGGKLPHSGSYLLWDGVLCGNPFVS